MMNELVDIAVQAAPARLPSITVQNGGWLGNTTAAGLGVIILYFSRRFATQEKVLWKQGGLIDNLWKGKVDTLSIFSFIIGFLCVTMILGAPDNPARTVIEWGQSFVMMLGENSFFAMFGAGGLCIVLFLLAYAKDNDCPKDIIWGSLCAIVFPLGGGMFTQFSLVIAGIASGGLSFS